MRDLSTLYFGSYEPSYSRNRIIKKGLEANRLNVLHDHASGLVIFRYFKLISRFLKIYGEITAIIVGFPGHYDIPLAFVLGKVFRKKVFYDIFASTYETYVLDRNVVKEKSLRAKFFYCLDWIGLKLADYVIVDTKAHANFYHRLYGLSLKKTIVVYVGSDPYYFHPRNVKSETDVLFYGSYQPLQGTDVIINAASRLPKVNFKMIGNGKQRKSTEELAKKLKVKNVQFVNWLPFGALALEINKAKICLGVFGTTEKAKVVIPNKVFDALACKKTVITSDSVGIRELLEKHPKAVALSKPNDALNLAQRIDLLIENSSQRDRIANDGYILYKQYYLPKIVTNSLYKKIANE